MFKIETTCSKLFN